MKGAKIILGVDPGTTIMGYGVVEISGTQALIKVWDVIALNKIKDHTLKLKQIFESTLKLIEAYQPDEMAVEAPFYGKNVQSMLKLGRAQGVVMAGALYRNIPIAEYSPRKIKQSITGNGSASKEQVALMMEKTFRCRLEHRYNDATDGLAVALCHHYQSTHRGLNGSGGSQSWKNFIANNPGKVKG